MKDRKANQSVNEIEQQRNRVRFLTALAVLFVLTLVFRIFDYALIAKPEKAVAGETRDDGTPVSENYTTTAHIVAVGNHICDARIYEKGVKSWDFSPLYENVREKIQSADCAIVALNTPLTSDRQSLSGYPVYRSPAELTTGLINTGFDIIAGAGSHSDDAGSDGIRETLKVWSDSYPYVPVLGIHATKEDAESVKIVSVNGINIAFLNYTYGTNTYSLRSSEAFMVDDLQKSAVTKAVLLAQQQSDCIIMIIDWGDTDSQEPNEFQKEWASYLMTLGVNVIIGTRPMSVQPYGTIRDKSGHETLVYYSLGNFIAIEEQSSRLLGGMADFIIEKNVTDGRTSISIKEKKMLPLVMHYYYETETYRSYLLSDYPADLAAKHSVSYSGQSISKDTLSYLFDTILSQNIEPATSISMVVETDAAVGYEVGVKDEYGGYYDSDGRYHDVSGYIFTDEGYYDLNNTFHSYEEELG